MSGMAVCSSKARAMPASRSSGRRSRVGWRTDVQRAAAGGIKAFGGIGAQELHESEAAAEALLGVGPALEEPLDKRGRVRSGLAAPRLAGHGREM